MPDASMEALVDLVRDGLVSAVLWALPLFAAALGASVIAGWLAARLGLQDAALGLVARAIAVVLTLGFVADTLGENARGFALDAFGRLAAIGRAEAGR